MHRAAALCFLIALAGAARANTTSLTFTVQEPSGVMRLDDPVTSGVPIALGDTSSAWALFDGFAEVPVQTKVLFGIRNPWLLLDFKVTLRGKAARTYYLISRPATVTASPALKIEETPSGSITVNTGPLKVVIGTSPFNLFDEVWLDRNHNGLFESGTSPSERLVSSTSKDNLPLVLAGDIARLGRRAPLRWSWEDRGPLRATLRVDGYYGDPKVVSDTLLYYTDRITFHAGQTYVTVQHLIRNSFAASERYVKVKSARLLVPGSSPATGRIRRSGDRVWINPGDRGASVEMIPDSLVYTADFRNGARTQKTMRVSSNGGMIIADLSYHGAGVRFDFSDTTLSASEQRRRSTSYIDRLAALAPATRYSDAGAFGSEHFGTWEDEKTANQQWGWKWPNSTPSPIRNVWFTCYSYEHKLSRPGWDYYPSWTLLSAALGPEEDNLWANLLMYARVGLRTYLDRAERWARYFAWEYAYRTDGFAYRNQTYCSPQVRTRSNLPASAPFTAADTSFIRYETQDVLSSGRNEANHSWNGGLVDYYYLTGDRDALAAALDIAEQTKKYVECVEIDSLVGGAALRFYARSYLNLLRAWEATGAPEWRLSANRLKAMFFHSLRYDARGCYYALGLPRYPGGKYVSPFQAGIVSQALYRDWVLTANGATDDSLAQRLRTLANFAYRYGANPDSEFTGDEIVLDYPHAGDVLHLSTSMLRVGQLPWESLPTASNSFVDALTIGYRLGGPPSYMSKAHAMWERASKYVMWTDRHLHRVADERHLGRFVNTLECGDAIGPTDPELTTMQFYFHDAVTAPFDYTPPAAVAGLSVAPAFAEAFLRWTAPGDDGATGRASAYDLRCSTAPITRANFASARPITTRVPDSAGTSECADAPGLVSCTPYWFAIRTRDKCDNWSELSNVAFANTNCTRGPAVNGCVAQVSTPDDPAAPGAVEFAIGGANPVVGPSTVVLGVPASMAGQKIEISIFDIAGRRVRTVLAGAAQAGRFRVPWNEGASLPSGAYFIAMRLGDETRTRRFVLVR